MSGIRAFKATHAPTPPPTHAPTPFPSQRAPAPAPAPTAAVAAAVAKTQAASSSLLFVAAGGGGALMLALVAYACYRRKGKSDDPKPFGSGGGKSEASFFSPRALPSPKGSRALSSFGSDGDSKEGDFGLEGGAFHSREFQRQGSFSGKANIRMCDLELEAAPFAEGGGGQVFKGKYMGSTVAAKRVFNGHLKATPLTPGTPSLHHAPTNPPTSPPTSTPTTSHHPPPPPHHPPHLSASGGFGRL